MVNKISTIFDFSERGNGLARIKAGMDEQVGLLNKLKAGWSGAATEFKNSAGAQAAALGGVAIVAQQSIAAASNLNESINAVTVAYGKNGESVLKLGEDSAQTWGLSQRAFNEFAVTFSGFANQIANRDGRAVSDVLSEMTTRIADFASTMNLDLSEAATTFQSAMAGETEPIRKFGIDMSAAAVEAYALANGLVKSKTEMTEAVKVQARYGLLMRETNKVAGDFANTSDGLANQQRIATAQIEDMAAKLGGLLIPVVSEAIGELNEFIATLDKIPGFDTSKLGTYVGGLRKLYDQLSTITNPGKLFVDVLGRIPVVGGLAGKALDGLGSAAKSAGGWLGFGGDKAEEFTENVADGIDTVARAKATQDAYTESLEHMYAAQNDSTEGLKGASDQQAAYLELLTQAGEAEQERLDWIEKATEAQERQNDILEEAAERTDDLISKKLELVGGEIAVHRAAVQAKEDAEALNKTIKDGSGTFAEFDEQLGQTVESQLEAASAAARFRADQMEANGTAVDSKIQTQLFKEELQRLAEQLDGPLRDALDRYIRQLGTIPTEVSTQVRFNGDGDMVRRGGGPRAAGGPTWPGAAFPISEDRPEVYSEGGRSWLIPNSNGRVTPMSEAGGGGGVVININGAQDPHAVAREVERVMRQRDQRLRAGRRD